MVKDLMPQLQAASKNARKSAESGEKIDSNGKVTIEMKPIKDSNKNLSASTDEFFKTFEDVIDDIDITCPYLIPYIINKFLFSPVLFVFTLIKMTIDLDTPSYIYPS